MMNTEDFFELIEKNKIDEVKKAIRNGFEINTRNKFGSSVVHIAVCENLGEMVKLLIDTGVSLNMQTKDGLTSLHYAAEYSKVELAELMLKNGADLSIQDKYGNQPLWTATFNDKGRNDRREIIKLFLKYGADVNHKNNVNKSPKDIVSIAGYKNLEDIIT